MHIYKIHVAWARTTAFASQETQLQMARELATMRSSISQFDHARKVLAARYSDMLRLAHFLEVPEVCQFFGAIACCAQPFSYAIGAIRGLSGPAEASFGGSGSCQA